MIQRLSTVSSRLAEELTLKLCTDEGTVSSELRHYLETLTALSDELMLSEGSAPDPLASRDTGTALPYVHIFHENGSYAGLCFHGMPGGHEFTSFVLGLYNTGGKGQPVTKEALSRVAAVDRDIRIRILASLSCTMCPELVTSAQRLTTLNPHITAEVFDLNRSPALRERCGVVSVSCLLVDDEPPRSGKENLAQLLDLLGA